MLPGVVATLLATCLSGYGVWERVRHDRTLACIPVRIHVNGTRGKSSVTRLIAGGLRSGGHRTFAKTTGTLARMINPDGSEVDVYRLGANIIEQIRIVRRAVQAGADTLVIECMAVTPELQAACEMRLIRSTIGVITNVRADHLDVMGPTVADAARAIAGTIPFSGHAFTAERVHEAILRKTADERRSTLHVVDRGGVSPQDLEGFPYLEHADNIALSLAVCRHLGVDRALALAGMHAAAPDPGALCRYTVQVLGKRVTFINAFAANDPDSTLLIWRRLGLDRPLKAGVRVIVANCRKDRVHRSTQLLDLVAGPMSAEHVVLTGDGTTALALHAFLKGIPRDRLRNLGGIDAPSIFNHLMTLAEDGSVIMGIGNIVGLGEEIVDQFRNRAAPHG